MSTRKTDRPFIIARIVKNRGAQRLAFVEYGDVTFDTMKRFATGSDFNSVTETTMSRNDTTIYGIFAQHGISLEPSPRANPRGRLDEQWRAHWWNMGTLFRAPTRDALEVMAYAYARRHGWIGK